MAFLAAPRHNLCAFRMQSPPIASQVCQLLVILSEQRIHLKSKLYITACVIKKKNSSVPLLATDDMVDTSIFLYLIFVSLFRPATLQQTGVCNGIVRLKHANDIILSMHPTCR
jgi:hypothetical protein